MPKIFLILSILATSLVTWSPRLYFWSRNSSLSSATSMSTSMSQLLVIAFSTRQSSRHRIFPCPCPENPTQLPLPERLQSLPPTVQFLANASKYLDRTMHHNSNLSSERVDLRKGIDALYVFGLWRYR